MAVRMKDIAEMAQVSLTTVSLVLNDAPIRISPEKRAEIKRIAKEYNYQPNRIAKKLASNKSNTIGVLIPDIENPFFAKAIKMIEEELLSKGYITIFMNSNDRFENDKRLIDRMISSGVDGLLLAFSNEAYLNYPLLKELIENIEVPFVLFDRGLLDQEVDQVVFNNKLGGYLATKHLIELGHQKIGVMMARDTSFNSKFRFEGYLNALTDHQITFQQDWYVESDFTFSDSYQKAERLLKNKQLTAIFAANDIMAFGIMKKARELSIVIPEDLSLIGYDNLEFNQVLDTPLTSVEQDVDKLAKISVFNILKKIAGEKVSPTQMLVPTLISGKTTKFIK